MSLINHRVHTEERSAGVDLIYTCIQPQESVMWSETIGLRTRPV